MPPESRLRLFEARLGYHTAFKYWNLRGILAERWGHGPDFVAYSDQDGQLLLTDAETPPAMRLAILGIRVSSFTWHLPPSVDEAHELAGSWLADCLVALEPRSVVRIDVRHRYTRPVRDIESSSRWFADQFPGTREVGPSGGYDTIVNAVNYQQRGRRREASVTSTGVIGFMFEDQAADYLQVQLPEDEGWHLGGFFDYSVIAANRDAGIPKPKDALGEAFRVGAAEAADVLERTLEALPDD